MSKRLGSQGKITKSGKIGRNTVDGAFIAMVDKLGQVPPCVRDAFSWLPHPCGHIGRGKNREIVWFWESPSHQALGFGVPPIQKADSDRCHGCVFQEPKWSQGYAGCSHSWLHDRDGDCRAFLSREEVLKMRPDYAAFCQPVGIGDLDRDTWAELAHRPYRDDGTRFCDFQPSLNFPSAYHAELNMPALFESGIYQAVGIEQERLRRFMQWARDETVRQGGTYQYNMFLDVDQPKAKGLAEKEG